MAITPSIAGGFRDYLPADMIPRQQMLDIIRATFERFGFVPLDTPGIEREEILTGGDENFRMQIFRTSTRLAFEQMALRFDLTVPLARVVAMYPEEIKKPFKRYQVGKVWRAEKPQAGRFREFIQFDADIVGSSSMMADAEIVALMYETMSALGFTRFMIRVNNRKVLNGLAEYANFPVEKTPAVLRVIDKLAKQGWDSVRQELLASTFDDLRSDSAEDDASKVERATGVGLSEDSVEAIKQFIDLRAGTQDETIASVAQLMAKSSVAQDGIQELRLLIGNTRSLGVPDNAWAIDLSVARGLGYYTGIVFETTLLDLPSIGSVFSGGRYDDLVSRFGSASVPATGASIGVDRLFAAMEELKIIARRRTLAQVFILNFDPESASYIQGIATQLRRGGISTELYLGSEVTLKAQLAFAVRQEYPVVIIAGSTEREKRVVQVKDMRERKQEEVSLNAVLDNIRAIL